MSDETEEQVESTANYTKSSAQLDLEARQEVGNENIGSILSTYGPLEEALADMPDGEARTFQLDENEGVDKFIDVDPTYAGYGMEQNRPLRAQNGPEAEVESVVYDAAPDDDDYADEVGTSSVSDEAETGDKKGDDKGNAAPAKPASTKPAKND